MRGVTGKTFLELSERDREFGEDLYAEGVFYGAAQDAASLLPYLDGADPQPQSWATLHADFGAQGSPSFVSWIDAHLSVPLTETADHRLGAGVAAQAGGHEVIIQATPNDARYTDGSLWGMYGDASSPVNQFGSQAAEAWAQGHTGSMSNVIGVIDTGIDYTHPDLYLNIWLNQREIPITLRASLSDIDSDGLITFRDLNGSANATYVLDYNGNGRIEAGDLLNDARWENGTDEDGNGYRDDLIGWDFVNNDNDPYDDHNHGSHVAGTIGALGGNSIGVVGVNWQIQMVALKFLSSAGSGSTAGAIGAVSYFTNAAISARTAGSAENFVATSNSWGGGSYNQGLLDAITAAAKQDILFVAAAGNDNSDNDTAPRYPTSYSTAPDTGHEAVISVASITSSGSRSSFSNYGTTSVDIAAPGSGVWSTISNGGYGSYNGTSMATPHVSGAVALYASLFPNATSAQIREALLRSATFTVSVNDLVASDGRLNIPAMLAIAPPVTEFADWLDGTNNAESINGLGGNDTLNGGLGADSLVGGAGVDLVSYAGATGAVTVSLASNLVTGAAGSDSLSGIENVLGGNGADSLLGDSASNQLSGGLGADTMNGGAGIDLVSYAGAAGAVTVNLASNLVTGAAGSDSLTGIENVLGGSGADSLLGDAASNQLTGGLGADTLNGGLGADSLVGDAGIDLVSYAVATGAVTVSLASNLVTGAAGSDSLSAIENVLGGNGADSLLGDAASNQLTGGDGADTLDGGLGADSLVGDAGIDLVSYAVATGAVTVSLASNLVTGAAGSDSLSGIENVLGGNGADSLFGDAASNQLTGGDGADTLDGATGHDTLLGGDGSDVLLGADGNDWLFGGIGVVTRAFLPAQQSPMSFIDIGSGSAPAFADFDNDGDLDLLVGRSDGGLSSFQRNANGSFTPMDGVGGNPANPFRSIDIGSFSVPSFTDFDLNGTLDLVVGRSDGSLAAYRRNTDGSFTPMDGAGGNPANPFYGIKVTAYSAPSFSDLDLDGDQDLVLGRTEGTLSAFMRKEDGSYTPMDGLNGNPANPFSGIDVGLYSIPHFADLDFDGDADLVVGGNAGTLAAFRRNTDGSYTPMNGLSGNPANPFAGISVGSDSAPVFADLNGDAIPDLVVGSGSGTLSFYVLSTNSSSSDSLAGGNGADTLDGADGADTLAGGSGNDLFIISDTDDRIIETAGGGADTIITSVSMTMPDQVEALRIAADVAGITITGGAGNDMLIGNGLTNNFNGGSGDDVILAGNVTLSEIYALFAI